MNDVSSHAYTMRAAVQDTMDNVECLWGRQKSGGRPFPWPLKPQEVREG